MNSIIKNMLYLSRENANSNRSAVRTNYLHGALMGKLSDTVPGNPFMEVNIPSGCSGGFKRCDIVFLNDLGNPTHIFPTKAPLSSINKNLNNYEEQLRGEVAFLRDANPEIIIEPINIYPIECSNGSRTEKLDVDRFLGANKSWCDAVHTILWYEKDGEVFIDPRSSSPRFFPLKD